MRAIVVLVALSVSSAAIAADLGGPRPQLLPVPAPVEEPSRPSIWQACWGQVAAAGTFHRDPAVPSAITSGGLGAGCDLQVASRVVFGGAVAYDWGSSDWRALLIQGRVGVTVNPHVLVYGLGQMSFDGASPRMDSAVYSLGGGIETFLGTRNNASLFIEATRDVLVTDKLRGLDDVLTARVGIRLRPFN